MTLRRTVRRPGQPPDERHGTHRSPARSAGAPHTGRYGPSGGPAPGEPGAGRATAGGRRPRTGTEPVTARSALRARLILASIFTPLFLAATAAFGYWTAQTGAGEAPSAGSLLTLTVACGLLALFSLVDLLVVLRRRRREPPPGPDGPGGRLPGRETGPGGT